MTNKYVYANDDFCQSFSKRLSFSFSLRTESIGRNKMICDNPIIANHRVAGGNLLGSWLSRVRPEISDLYITRREASQSAW